MPVACHEVLDAIVTGTTGLRRRRTPSRERRKRRKWSIGKFTEEKKEVKKLNPFELLEASCLWFLDFQDTNDASAIRFISHIVFIAGKAKTFKFQDTAHTLYDTAVLKLAAKDGFEAFSAGNTDLALRYYSFEHLRESQAKMPALHCIHVGERSLASTSTVMKAARGMNAHAGLDIGAHAVAATVIPV